MKIRSAARQVLRTAERFSLKFWKWQKNFPLIKALFFSKTLSGLIEANFDNPAVIFPKTVENVSIKNWKMIRRSYEVFQKNFSSEKLPWTRRMLFWQPSRKIFGLKVRKSLVQSPKTIGKKLVSLKELWKKEKTILRSHRKQLWQTLRKVFARSPKPTN